MPKELIIKTEAAKLAEKIKANRAAKEAEKAKAQEEFTEPALNKNVIGEEQKIKAVYAYDSETGLFICQSLAYECQLEKGVFNMPSNTTDLKPLENRAGFNCVFDKKRNAWKYVAIEKEVVKVEPVVEKTKAELSLEMREKRDQLLKESDFSLLADAPFSIALVDAFKEYRKQLRDLPQSAAFPYLDLPSIPTENKTLVEDKKKKKS